MTRSTSPLWLTSALVLLSAGVAGCSAASAESTPAAQASATRAEIMRLRTRDGDVAVLSGSGGRQVAIYDGAGALVRRSDIDALRLTDPSLFELLTTATASRGSYLDATLTTSAPSLDSVGR
jgi:hypothetical protein